jgi:hypothetical protein
MPSAHADAILAALTAVQRERERRQADALLGKRVTAVKQRQQQRLAATYADLLANPRYRQAATFFLEELYGPKDFVRRDTQFARVVPGLVRLFPDEVVRTVVALAQLHALSERFDTQMGEAAGDAADHSLDAAAYGRAWRAVGQPAERQQQIALLLQVGQALDRHTRSRLLRASLHMMRAPARAAGLEALQHFLESGFDAFGAMAGAGEFLRIIGERERKLADELFAEPPGA